MEFRANCLLFKSAPPPLSFVQVWGIESAELAAIGSESLQRLNASDDPVQKLYRTVTCLSHALLEFQDLQDMPLPKRGRFMNVSYLYCEAVSALRQAVLCGLNGQVHASFATLRCSLETLVYHYWWKRRLSNEDDNEKFYEWLFGKEQSAAFSRVLRDTLADLEHPPQAFVFDELRDIYRQLCSYAHKPLFEESLITIRGGNVHHTNDKELSYWLSVMEKTQRCMLDVAILSSPQALFPVDVYRKFGFNPPMGVFLDKFGGFSLEKALGETAWEAYREHFKKLDPPSSQIDWYEGLRNLSDEEIVASWYDEEPDDNSSGIEDKIMLRASLIKAKMRAILWRLSYQRDTIEMPDLRELNRNLTEGLG